VELMIPNVHKNSIFWKETYDYMIGMSILDEN